MWPIDEINDRIKRYNAKKRETFGNSCSLPITRSNGRKFRIAASICPESFTCRRIIRPARRFRSIVMVPGMDGYKEKYVALYGDPWMQRGFAFLAVEGPGYWEAPLRGLYVDVPGWVETGKEVMKWLIARPEIDADKIAVVGSSFGSFFSAIMMSDEPRYKACAVTGTCYEPGGHSIFEEASPTFKHRFMFMSGITDEREFDEFRKTLDWHGYAEKVKVPYLIAGGEADELCPLENTEAFVKSLGGPKQLMIYADARHSIGGAPSAANGPDTRSYQAKWLQARLAGKPFTMNTGSWKRAGRSTSGRCDQR